MDNRMSEADYLANEPNFDLRCEYINGCVENEDMNLDKVFLFLRRLRF
jgi:hypothetical protein